MKWYQFHFSTFVILIVAAGAMLWPVIVIAQGIWKVDPTSTGVMAVILFLIFFIVILIGIGVLSERLIDFPSSEDEPPKDGV